MPRSRVVFTVLCLAVLPPAPADAQVTLDVAKITCDQFTGYTITNPRDIALWLSGYYNGKKNNTIVEPQKLTADTQKLTQYCLSKPNMALMQAVQKVFGAAK